MSNMSYCRFHNTLQDLEVCEDYLNDTDISEDEHKKRRQLVETCKRIVEQCYDDDELETGDWAEKYETIKMAKKYNL